MKNKVLKVGITGGIGAGKTTVTNIFSLLGVPVYYADDRAKYILHHDETVSRQVREKIGQEAFKDGKLDTQYISKEVFKDAAKLALLNSIVHPRVGQDFEQWVNLQTGPYILKEAALLYEAGSYKDLDKMITVFAPVELRIKRVLQRDPQRTEEVLRGIIEKQMPDAEKVSRADYVIRNDDTELLIPQVLALHQVFMAGSTPL
ncbi:MAG: dephospho-CoA kinase [Cytophagaceae bacterium]